MISGKHFISLLLLIFKSLNTYSLPLSNAQVYVKNQEENYTKNLSNSHKNVRIDIEIQFNY